MYNINLIKDFFYSRLVETLKEKLQNTQSEIEFIDNTLKNIVDFDQQLEQLNNEIIDFYVWSENIQQTETDLNNLCGRVDVFIDRVKKLIQDIRERYLTLQQLIPSDIQQKLTNLELLAEKIVNTTMEDKNKEFKRARTVRLDYLHDVDNVQVRR